MKALSYSVWGDNPLYVEGMKRNIELAKDIYPGWTVLVFTDADTAYDGAQTFRMDKPNEGISGMFWRFLPVSWEHVEVTCVRDADSRLTEREKHAVDEWLKSGFQFHVMRDHPDHRFWPMLGGMWGAKQGAIPAIATLMERWGVWKNKLDDMHFLKDIIWPDAKHSCMVHSSVPDPLGGRPFPDGPPNGTFVGQIIQPQGSD